MPGRRPQRYASGVLPSRLLFAWLVVFASACSSPEPAPAQLSLRSDRGLVSADIQFVGAVTRGANELLVRLDARAIEGDARLLAVDATMAAHAHVTHAERIDDIAGDYHVQNLDLFMTGRWQVEMSLALDETQDTLSFPVDVP